jgi:predicted RNase H-like HicB family nuclease
MTKVKVRIPVLFFFDEESKNWGFSVEEPGVVGGGDSTPQGAMQHAAEAVAFALQGHELEPTTKGQIGHLEIEVIPIDGLAAASGV